MSKELIVSTSPHELRVAITEEDQLVEIYIESESQHGLAGSIYKGRVTRVLPGMQSAFVNIGLSRDAFLYVSDFLEEAEDTEASSAAADEAESKALAAVEGERTAASEQRPAEATDRSGRDEERRGRRGRRGRRRRGKSDGFPQEKYADVRPAASELEREDETPDSEPAQEPREPYDEKSKRRNRQASRTFAVLPGESLAKYSDAAPEAAPDGEFETPAADDEGDRAGDGGNTADVLVSEAASGVDAEQGGLSEEAGGGSAPVRSETLRSDVTREPWAGSEVDAEGEPPETSAAEPAGESPSSSTEADSAEPQFEVPDLAASPDEDHADESENGIPPDGLPTSGEAEESSGESEESADVSAQNKASHSDEEHPRIPGNPQPPEEARVRDEGESARYSRRRGRRGRRRRGRRRDEGAEQATASRAEAEPEAVVPEEASVESRTAPADSTAPASDGMAPPGTSISDLLKKGQEILVQIAKEPLGRKGARITSHIALPGRFLVYMPTVDHVGVSRKIASDRERGRLRRIVQTHRTGMPGGFIVRTAGEGASEEDVHGDMLFLYNLWLDIRQKAERKQSPALIHQDLDVVERVMRDQIGEDYKTIWVDGEDEYERTLRFVERFQPELVGRVKLYTRSKPIFDEFGITQDLERALRPKVWLKSGGYIVINPTEALVSIDVNTGKFVGKSDRLEDTIVKTNLEAAAEIVRQMRLRDLGGIIVVDFIDMDDRKNRQSVLRALEEAMRADRAPSKVLSFNEFGLLAITRKRVKQSLERALCTPCPYCNGSGYVKSPQTVVYEILAEAKKMAGAGERRKDVTLRVNPEVARLLKSKDNLYLQEVEEILRSNVLVRSDVGLNRENFDIN